MCSLTYAEFKLCFTSTYLEVVHHIAAVYEISDVQESDMAKN